MPDDFISDEDKALFRQMMASVKPLDKTKRKVVEPTPALKPRTKQPIEIRKNERTTTYLTTTYIDTVDSETILSYGQDNIPNKRFRELKSGQIPWQARLDLHGLTSNNARDSLCRFLDKQLLTENRCLLIIHGKGGQGGEAPVLKNSVNDWLRQLPQILAFHSARAKDGGTGALYVLLKRKREAR